ncbi:MAG: C-terminal target protein [Bacteroidetes bacterium]|jgi:photosystem II stability/assembly factor-like uncharacterized protein|nr:C-terminal target protein [Bacteroidota bacterium]
MKKLLLSASLVAACISADAQYWNPYFANLDTTWGVRYMSAVDTNIVWAVGYDGTFPSRTSNKFTRTTDGMVFTPGTFYADTNSFSPSNISAVNDTMAYIATYFKSGAGTPGQILKTVDGGVTWNNVATANMFNSAANFPNVVHFWDTDHGWAQGDPNNTFGSGNEFELWKTSDGGVTWARTPGANIPNPTTGEYGTVDIYSVYGSKWMWYGTNKGRMFASVDTGNTWTAVQIPGMLGGVISMSFSDSLHGLVLGDATASTATTTYMLQATADGGATWTNLTGTGSVSSDFGRFDLDAIPGVGQMYMSVGINLAQNQYVTSVTYDNGANWMVLESGITDIERVIEIDAVDSLHVWAGAFSDNVLPYGTGGIRKNWGAATIGLKPLAETNKYVVYPNPGNGQVSVRLHKALTGTTIKVTDMLGKVVYSTVLKMDYLNQELHLDLSGNAKGIYLMQITNGKNNEVQKLIIE